MGEVTAVLQFVDVAGRELLLFAGIWFFVGLVDEIAVDAIWFWLRLKGRGRALTFLPPADCHLSGPAAVLVPCWHEADVIQPMISSCRSAWPHAECTFYVGCYRNDPETIAAARRGAADDARVRVTIIPHDGPTTKGDCLNVLYRAMEQDELSKRQAFDFVLLHDAEDKVHPLALDLIDDRLKRADFVQLPVIPELDEKSRWISGHYADEFAENHLKTLVVRDWLRTALPAAGVGCAFRRDLLARIAQLRGASHPFDEGSLTEDYELGLLVKALGGRSRFVRALDAEGQLIATREYFPSTIGAAVRQKARWIHGIAFQGWERLGWSGRAAELWMRMRDRRGPLTAIVLFAAYLAVVCWSVVVIGQLAGLVEPRPTTSLVKAVVLVGVIGLIWRAVARFAFTAALYGRIEGLCAIVRLPVANLITIFAAHRALAAYLGTLRGQEAIWDKTHHERLPAVADEPNDAMPA
jgi:adsorption protein B